MPNEETYSLTFSKTELTVIFNVLVAREYRLADARLVDPLVKRIEPLVAQADGKDFPMTPLMEVTNGQ